MVLSHTVHAPSVYQTVPARAGGVSCTKFYKELPLNSHERLGKPFSVFESLLEDLPEVSVWYTIRTLHASSTTAGANSIIHGSVYELEEETASLAG